MREIRVLRIFRAIAREALMRVKRAIRVLSGLRF